MNWKRTLLWKSLFNHPKKNCFSGFRHIFYVRLIISGLFKCLELILKPPFSAVVCRDKWSLTKKEDEKYYITQGKDLYSWRNFGTSQNLQGETKIKIGPRWTGFYWYRCFTFSLSICEEIKNTPGPEEKAIMKCVMRTARRQEVSSRTWFLIPQGCNPLNQERLCHQVHYRGERTETHHLKGRAPGRPWSSLLQTSWDNFAEKIQRPFKLPFMA